MQGYDFFNLITIYAFDYNKNTYLQIYHFKFSFETKMRSKLGGEAPFWSLHEMTQEVRLRFDKSGTQKDNKRINNTPAYNSGIR